MVKNSHLTILTFVSFLNELSLVYLRGGVIQGRTSFFDTVQCFYEEKWTVGNYLHITLHLHRYFQVEKQRLTYIQHLN